MLYGHFDSFQAILLKKKKEKNVAFHPTNRKILGHIFYSILSIIQNIN